MWLGGNARLIHPHVLSTSPQWCSVSDAEFPGQKIRTFTQRDDIPVHS